MAPKKYKPPETFPTNYITHIPEMNRTFQDFVHGNETETPTQYRITPPAYIRDIKSMEIEHHELPTGYFTKRSHPNIKHGAGASRMMSQSIEDSREFENRSAERRGAASERRARLAKQIERNKRKRESENKPWNIFDVIDEVEKKVKYGDKSDSDSGDELIQI